MGADIDSTTRGLNLAGRTLMVLGAGIYQMPVINTAKNMGLKVVAVDGSSQAPGLAIAHASRVVDIRDADSCLNLAKEFDIDGIVSICTDIPVETIAVIGKALNLPTIGNKAALNATDKYVMRQQFEAAGVPGPVFRQALTLEQAGDAAASIGYPLVIKPVDNAGSRGVRRVDNPSDLVASFEIALSHSRKKMVILEEYIEGVEATIESLTFRGQTEILAMSDKIHVPFPECVSICLTYPPYFPSGVQEEIRTVVKRAISALGIDQGPTHSEVMVTENGVKLVEVGARGGGFQIFSDIIPLVSGVNIVQETIHIALGIEPQIKAKYQRAAVLRFFNPDSRGTLRAVEGADKAAANEGILELKLDIEPGQTVGPITSDGERPGYLISYGDTRESAVKRADDAEAMVYFDIEPVTI